MPNENISNENISNQTLCTVTYIRSKENENEKEDSNR